MIKDSLLWKISPSGSNLDSYLFGSMHVKDEVAFKHVDKVISRLCQCEKLMCEIDLNKAQSEISQDAYMIPNTTLSQLIKPKKYQKYRRVILKTYGFDLDYMESYYPLVIFNKISESLLSKDRAFPLDMFLWKKAHELKIPTDGIENLEGHIAVMRRLDIDTQLKMLKHVLKNTSAFKKSLSKITQLYADQKIQKLYKVTKNTMGSFRNILIYDRNQIMAERIVNNQNESCMYVVGAAHLAGNLGVLNLLKKKKYKLTAI